MSATTITADKIPTGVYAVDPTHSNVGFEVRHMGIATVRGSFKGFEGKLDASGDSLVLEGTVQAATLDTGEENRDGHLKSPEFFDVDRHPTITFASAGAETEADGLVHLHGEITIRGETKPIELTGTIASNGQDPWGNDRIGLDLQGVIDRREFGLTWNQTLPNGGLLVANEVKLVLGVSAVRGS